MRNYLILEMPCNVLITNVLRMIQQKNKFTISYPSLLLMVRNLLAHNTLCASNLIFNEEEY